MIKDYRQFIIQHLSDIADNNPAMSFGEIIYSVTRNKNTNLNIKNLYQLTTVEDTEWCGIVEKVLEDEQD